MPARIWLKEHPHMRGRTSMFIFAALDEYTGCVYNVHMMLTIEKGL